MLGKLGVLGAISSEPTCEVLVDRWVVEQVEVVDAADVGSVLEFEGDGAVVV